MQNSPWHGGIVVGSEMSGGVQKIYAYNCNFNNTDRGLRFKTMKGRGGFIKDLWFKDIEMNNIKNEAIIVNMKYGASSIAPRGDKMPKLSNFNFNKIRSNNSKTCLKVVGDDSQKIEGLNFKNVNMSGTNGLIIENLHQAKFESILIENKRGEPIKVKNCESIVFNKIRIKSNSKIMFKSEGKNTNILVNESNKTEFKELGL